MKIKLIPKQDLKLDSNKVKALVREFLEAQLPQPVTPKASAEEKKLKPIFPMDYILFKFPNLKKVLNELLTVTFKEYISNIYVVAPKPTTFKVVLKNKQEFYIIYDDRSYVVKIEGKRYYLLNLGEKERAIKAIANLLTMKQFITSKGGDEEDEEKDKDKKGPKKETGAKSKSKSSGGGSSLADIGTDLGDDPKDNEDLPDLDSILGPEGGADTDKDESEKEEPLNENFTIRITK